jgi:hypothetical protein
VILGTLVLAEPLTPRTIVAGAVIVFAVALIITARGRMRAPAESTLEEESARPAAAGRGRTEPART